MKLGSYGAPLPEFAVRVRGAMGRWLHGFGPPILGRKDYGARPRAWDVLFETVSRVTPNTAIAKPLVIHTDVRDGMIEARAILVGSAGFWLPDAEAALLGALEGGIAGWENGRIKVPLACEGARRERISGVVPPRFPVREARLKFVTPLQVRSGDATLFSGPSIMIAIANRVARMAPWQSARLDVDWGRIHQLARAFEYDVRGMWPYGWTRGSQRMRSKLPMSGVLGDLVVRGTLDDVVPFLQMAELVNVGSHAALGLGRFRLTLLP